MQMETFKSFLVSHEPLTMNHELQKGKETFCKTSLFPFSITPIFIGPAKWIE